MHSAFVVLTVTTLVLMAFPVARSFFKAEIDYNEGWKAYYSQNAVQGHRMDSGQLSTAVVLHHWVDWLAFRGCDSHRTYAIQPRLIKET